MNTAMERKDFEPILTKAEIKQTARKRQAWAMQKQLALSVLTKSRTELEQMMTDSPVEITNMMEMVISTREQYKAITEALEIAEARLISVVDAELVKLTGESALA
jgi:methyltransferase-like protein